MVETSAAIPGSLVWGPRVPGGVRSAVSGLGWTFFNPSLPKATWRAVRDGAWDSSWAPSSGA